jgi:uncharacterized membrane protein YeiB
MEPILAIPEETGLSPVRREERIQALDVIRGFALLGIFLMNIEWFSRAQTEMPMGLPIGLTGADWWASRVIYVLVQGKFWTIFSLLFGMGFAVMLARSEQAGRSFLKPYLRRIAALAVFGAIHYILLYTGDILFSYAVAAVALLIVLYGNWKYILGALPILVGLGFLPKAQVIWASAGSLAYIGLLALYLRHERRMRLLGRSLPVFAFVLLLLGLLGTGISGALWILHKAPLEARTIGSMVSVSLLILGGLWAAFHDPGERRLLRLGLVAYLFPFVMMTIGGTIQRFKPPPAPAAQAEQAAAQPAKVMPDDKSRKNTEAERRSKREAEKTKRIQQQREEIQTETRVMSKGRFPEVVRYRALRFFKHAPEEAGFATILIGMFLLGAWFVRSGVITNAREHLPLFRKLAWVALPLGVGLGLLGSSIATSHVPGAERDGFQMATGLLMVGNLPACLGYVSVIVLMLHSDTRFSKIQILAPVGRMALTNYLMQSAIMAVYFLGHGLGHWGMPRAWQVVFVLVVFAFQVGFSRWWLGRFHYGPMEWLWRAITYWHVPPFRLDPRDDHPLQPAGLHLP